MKENILIFFLILSVDAKHRSHKIKQLKNFKDIKKVKYLRKEYTKEKISEIQIKSKTIYINTRVATLFLACTYGKILKKILFIINHFVQHCKKSFENKYNNYGYFCTNIFLDTIYNLVPMTTKMKGAMDAIESFHYKPWYNNRTTHYIFSKTFTLLKEIPENYKKSLISQNDPLSNKKILIYCNRFFSDRKNEVELDINMFCEVVPECLKSAWANLLEKYNNILKNKQEIYFYDFLHKEINEIIKSSIEEKYDKFGFTYDQDTIINQMLPPNPKKRRLTSHKCIPDLKVETIP
ncbi:uncharacterized protein LOC126907796 isoform X1 [Daktulosphaira vitifoliae]|uniref:uncharacterized protein LOC126907796 isoform X1 n=1 Tax=Daktulosphaira vitifoliae TaxID=58002 RepID=UPI0021AAA2C2|nr:uncharacterized protein LOC126907796 isoform X1 [Daktulosphaira vitifoliae]